MESKTFFVSNPNYRKDGTKSYTFLLRKYRFSPTKEGPYSIGRTIHQTGRPFSSKPVGGRVRFHDAMQKHLANNQIQPVEINDVQQEAPCFLHMNVGTPSQTLCMILDTASTDVWIRSTGLSHGDEERRVFDPMRSSTFRLVEDATWKLTYVDGSSASGFIGTDNVSLGGLILKDQHIELADMLSMGFTQMSGDGLLGLSLGGNLISTRTHVISPLVERMKIQTDPQPDAKLFTINFGVSGRSNDGRPFCTFGYIDQELVDKCDQKIHYAKVDDHRGHWMVDSVSTVIDENTIDRPTNKAIVDTAAGLTLLDDHVCQMIYDCLPGAFYDPDRQGFVFPSDVEVERRPHVQLEIGGKHIAISQENLAFADTSPGYVFGSIQSRGSMDVDVLGDAFLEGVYAVFDVGGLRFGVVQL
ncbi:hypothetical protein FE257_002915 [Aspergillus nanangensis]|uniref:Peptidase A1 domain-containing protein n=1 Tax=Aspergillus nanangensis TaxID=2582783 RepID=A0AAD4CT12_ASPNN|nr:hypothetical protein FE257_002915 [Aspergillus nanangensis]